MPTAARAGLASLIALVVLTPSVSSGEDRAVRRIVIVTPAEAEERLLATRDAIAFWNQTLSDLQLPPRLVEDRVLVAPPIARRLEGYTRQIWNLAGRVVSASSIPTPPQELMALDGDIVVLLSRQRIFSFAWPFAERTRYFVGIQTDTVSPLDHPNVSRNVIAHELGHTLGLEHNGYTSTLMCGPCDHLLYWSERPIFFPLSPAERARLITLHQPR